MLFKTRKTVKKYRQGNIAVAYGTDLWLSGSTNVPNLLLRFYKYMHITDMEMMTLIHLFRLRAEERDLHPAPESLAEYLSVGAGEVENLLHSLFEKKLVVETLYYDESRDAVQTGYDFEPLFEKLYDCWACARVKEIEKAGPKLDGHVHRGNKGDTIACCCGNFEKEFGRPLSPIEMEKISQWVEQTGPELVGEALKRAVLIGKRNFRYIDTILLEWMKNNLKTIQSLEEHDRRFQDKRPARESRGRTADRSGEDSRTENSKRKALIKKLYLS